MAAKSPKVARTPWIVTEPDISVTAAIKAVAYGTADPEQQMRAMRWILEVCSGGGWAYRPEGDRETCIALGMQRVGEAIKRQINIITTKQKESENG